MRRTDTAAASIKKLLPRIVALQRNRMARDSAHGFWIEGIRQFVHACDARLEFDTVVYSKVLLKSGLARMLIGRLRAAGVRVIMLTPEQFRAVSLLERASGVAAIVRQPWTPLADVDPCRAGSVGWCSNTCGRRGTSGRCSGRRRRPASPA